ncbi:MAG: hypothetical protein F6J86_10525 [Symploca sp. SIO1B1]|nr:hypothetical protein [Symploca sp. SIO1B1]
MGLAQWLREQSGTYFCLRLKKNEYVEVELLGLDAIKRFVSKTRSEFLFARCKNNQDIHDLLREK